MNRTRELEKELGRLRSDYTLSDKSEENIKKGERIKEIMNELGLGSKPRADRRKTVITWR